MKFHIFDLFLMKKWDN